MKRVHRYALLLLVMMLILSGCGTTSTEQSSQKGSNEAKQQNQADGEGPIRIGFFAPRTGPAAADGASAYNSAILAVEHLNEQGGVLSRKIELVDYDDQLDSKQAVAIAQKLTTKDRVVAVVSGSYSSPTRAAAPIFNQANIPMIAAYAVHPDIPKTGEYIFQQSFSGYVQGRAAAVVVDKDLKAKSVSILAVDNDFGRTISDGFEEQASKLGLQVLSKDTFKMGDKEFAPVLTKIKQLKPDVLLVIAYAGEGSQIVRQVRDLQLDVQILGTEGLDSTTEFLEVVGAAGEGVVIVTNLNRDDQNQQTKAYLVSYRNKFGHDPDMVGASVYDAFQLMAEAIRRAGSTDPKEIRDALAGIRDYITVTGPLYRYDDIRQAIKPVAVQQINGGSFRYLDEITDLDVITPPGP